MCEMINVYWLELHINNLFRLQLLFLLSLSRVPCDKWFERPWISICSCNLSSTLALLLWKLSATSASQQMLSRYFSHCVHVFLFPLLFQQGTTLQAIPSQYMSKKSQSAICLCLEVVALSVETQHCGTNSVVGAIWHLLCRHVGRGPGS